MAIEIKPPAVLALPWAIILLAWTPALMVLLPWDFGQDSTIYREYMRTNSFPATIVEIIFVLLAFTRGFAPAAALSSLPVLAKVGLSMLTIGIIWTTTFVAREPIIAMLGVIKLFAHVMFALAMLDQLQRWTMPQRALVWPAVGFGVLLYCGLWALNALFCDPEGNDWIRLVPTLTNVRWIGGFAMASFCAGIGLLAITADPGGRRWRFAIGVILGSVGLVLGLWTGTRAAVSAILFAAAVSTLLLPIRRQLLVYTLVSMVIALAVTVALPRVHPIYGIDRMIGASISQTGDGDVTSGRIEIWTNMIPKIIDRPIMGWGIDQFRFSFPEGTPSIRQPHNGPLQLLFSTGSFGVMASLLIAIAFFHSVCRKFTEPWQFASVTFISGASAYGLYDGIFYYSYPIMIYIVAGCCLVVQRQSEDGMSNLPGPTAADQVTKSPR